MATTKTNTPPTRAQMALLCEMTLGGKTLRAHAAGPTGYAMRYRLHTSGAIYSTWPESAVRGLRLRGLIEVGTIEPYPERGWDYTVTEAGRAAVTAAMAETWEGNDR